MSRTLPTECEHGRMLDGGDFAASERCPDCERAEFKRAELNRAQTMMGEMAGLIPYADTWADIDWKKIGWALRIPFGWRLWPRRNGDRWKLTAAGADPMPCGHCSMQVTADSLVLAVALMAGRVNFHRTERP